MGKKVKKKAARSAQKEKRFPTTSPKTVSQEIVSATDTVIDGVPISKETKQCPHLEKGIDFEKFSSKISSLESLKCDDCREGVADRKPRKGKGKSKGSGSKSESISIWVCVECGHFSCGGVGFPTTPQSHAARHSKQHRHPVVIKFANPNLRWCFLCNTVIPVQTTDENGEQKDVLSEFVKVLKTRSASSSSETRVDVEDIWFGSGSVISGVKSQNTLLVNSENNGVYTTRGLVNLGNTCFFNSVLQNLLAMDKLRDYFLNLEGPTGPLSSSLKKLYVETSPSTGGKNVVNPRSFFSCLCVKAPQFRGYQQHDSHELLRCLLDGLCTEESGIRKRSKDAKNVQEHTPTFVDTIFGGQISSTVSCLECGHASVVFEPCLDLSLPLPTKRSPSKKVSSVSRSKKPKLPPKRQGKLRTKTKKTSSASVASSVLNVSNSDESTEPTKSTENVNDNGGNNGLRGSVEEAALLNNNHKASVDSINESSSLDNSELTMVSNGQDAASNGDVSVKKDVIQYEEVQQSTVETHVDSEDTSWLDYLEPSNSTFHDTESHNQDSSIIQDSGNSNDVFCEDEPLLKVQESEVLLLPYKEVNSEQEPSDFDGFGGLFDEPEVASGPTMNPVITNGVEGNSESDPDEVDNSDSPLSVEKCLAYFTTPELLTKTEHAWQCEQCSKSLLEQKTRLKNKLQKPVSNGGENGVSTASSDSKIEHSLPNGRTESADVALDNGKNENSGVGSEFKEDQRVVISADTESCSVNGPTDESKNEIIQHKERELDSSEEDDEVDSKAVKVARDASKRILISKAPPVLTIHLKRFCQDARGRLSKLNGHVDFRETIDLKPYMDPSRCKDRETYKYRLVGVVEHLGTMRGGHYVAYIKGGAKRNSTGAEDKNNCIWYHASDAYVREASLEEVLRCEAYILFYEEM